MAEPQWVQSIASGTVCDWFYTFFWLYAILALITILGAVGLFSSFKLPLGLKLTMGFSYFLILAVSSIHFLFAYIVCDRSLLSHAEGYIGNTVIANLSKAAPRKR